VSTGVNSPRTAGTQKNLSHLHLKPLPSPPLEGARFWKVYKYANMVLRYRFKGVRNYGDVEKLIREGYIHICLSYWPKTKKWTVVAPKLKRPSGEW